MPYVDSANREVPFQSGSGTSHQAAVRAESFADTQRERYHRWLADRIEGGTDGEAEVELMMRRSSVCARRSELREQGRVVRFLDCRRGGCQVWRAV